MLRTHHKIKTYWHGAELNKTLLVQGKAGGRREELQFCYFMEE
jgi:hypothetical protein